MQLQISSINNGFLVATPREQTKPQHQLTATEVSELQQPVCHFCQDYDEVCHYIKRFMVGIQ